jgi:hypothetical protein
MRARSVEIGGTYWVLVPARLPAVRYPDRNRPGTPEWSWGWMTGCRFRLTVTSVDAAARMVDGVRMAESSAAEVVLTGDQAAALGLPDDGRYVLRGGLADQQGRPVTVPELRRYRVPVRWLRPADGPAPKTHTDLDILGR